jgi:hypothetical protein
MPAPDDCEARVADQAFSRIRENEMADVEYEAWVIDQQSPDYHG